MITATPLLLSGIGISSKIVQGDDPSLANAIALVGSGAVLNRPGFLTESLPLTATKGATAEALTNDLANAVAGDPLLQTQLDKFSATHQIEQIANGEKHITLDAKIVSDKTLAVQGGKQRTLEIEQQVVEQRYFEHGNLADFTATLRAGQAPTIDAAFLAMIDLVDAVTLNALRPLLIHWKVDPHILHRKVEMRVDDLEKDGVENIPQTVDKQVDQKIEENLVLDNKLETVNIRTVDSQKLSHIEGKQITTIIYAPHAQTVDVSGIPIIEKTERSSFVTVQEYERAVEHNQSTVTESKQIWGFDVGDIAGEKVTSGPETQNIKDSFKLRIYEANDGGDFTQALADGKLIDDEVDGLKLGLVDEKRIDSAAQFSVLNEGGVKKFESGFIEWLPLGSLVSMGMKSSYGMDVSASDAFWAATDVVLSVGTLGTAAIIANSTKTVGKQVVKGIAKGTVRGSAEVVAKEGGKVGREVFNDTRGFRPDVLKHPERLSLQGAEKMAQSNVKTLANKELSHSAKSGAMTAENGAKAIGESLTSLKPNTTTTKNGYQFTTDALGRPNAAKGQLHLEKIPHDPSKQRAAAEMGHAGDHGGHLIGAQFSGPSELFNLVPQNSSLNLGEWKKMEMGWKKALEAGKTIEVNIHPLYKGTSLRPHKFVAEYWVDGVKEMRVFTNHLPKV